jgi:aminoglycoside phosphotransferase (APT) family kinase protein
MSPAEPPGPLLGSGRSADVYAIGTDRVLRRYRSAWDVQAEAGIMQYLDQAGFPVPKVYDADGPDLVMERLDGPDMLSELGRRPWTIGRYGKTLADLHNRLHQITAPPGLREMFGPGDKVLHLDLHPANVMLTSRGPVVIDWSNAHAGAAGADVAMAYLIMATSDTDLIPVPLRLIIGGLRAALFRAFLGAARDDPYPHLSRVARARMKDPNCRPSEQVRLLKVAERADRQAAATGS